MKGYKKKISFAVILGALLWGGIINAQIGDVFCPDVVLANIEAVATDESEGGCTAAVICSDHPATPVYCTGKEECEGSVSGGYVRCDGQITYC